jgi:hypothetical protein
MHLRTSASTTPSPYHIPASRLVTRTGDTAKMAGVGGAGDPPATVGDPPTASETPLTPAGNVMLGLQVLFSFPTSFECFKLPDMRSKPKAKASRTGNTRAPNLGPHASFLAIERGYGLLKPKTGATIRRLRGILKRKLGDQTFAKERSDHKRTERKLEDK